MDKADISIILLVDFVNCAFASVLERAVLIQKHGVMEYSGTIYTPGFSAGREAQKKLVLSHSKLLDKLRCLM